MLDTSELYRQWLVGGALLVVVVISVIWLNRRTAAPSLHRYNDLTRMGKWQVVVRAKIDSTGRVLSAQALRNDALPKVVLIRAEEQVRQTRFAPESRGGRGVPHEIDVCVVVTSSRDFLEANTGPATSMSALA